MANVQISEELIKELFKYHVLEIPADMELIHRELEAKLNSMAKRQKYSQSLTENKTAP